MNCGIFQQHSSDGTPSLGTSICHEWKKKKKHVYLYFYLTYNWNIFSSSMNTSALTFFIYPKSIITRHIFVLLLQINYPVRWIKNNKNYFNPSSIISSVMLFLCLYELEFITCIIFHLSEENLFLIFLPVKYWKQILSIWFVWESFFLVFFFLSFLGPHLQNMEVARLGVESKL